MDWSQALTIVGANIALIIAMYGANLLMYLHLDRKVDENRKETNEILRAIQAEIMDFHGKICAIEQRKNK